MGRGRASPALPCPALPCWRWGFGGPRLSPQSQWKVLTAGSRFDNGAIAISSNSFPITYEQLFPALKQTRSVGIFEGAARTIRSPRETCQSSKSDARLKFLPRIYSRPERQRLPSRIEHQHLESRRRATNPGSRASESPINYPPPRAFLWIQQRASLSPETFPIHSEILSDLNPQDGRTVSRVTGLNYHDWRDDMHEIVARRFGACKGVFERWHETKTFVQ
jgi:hypothetical protein